MDPMKELFKSLQHHFMDFLTASLIAILAILFYLPLLQDISRGMPLIYAEDAFCLFAILCHSKSAYYAKNTSRETVIPLTLQ